MTTFTTLENFELALGDACDKTCPFGGVQKVEFLVGLCLQNTSKGEKRYYSEGKK